MNVPSGYSSRAADANDVEELEQLFITLDLEEGVEPSYLAEDMGSAWRRTDFDVASDTFVVTSDGGAIAAYGHVETRPPTALIAMGWVHPEHRGLGLGTYLIKTLESRARAKGADADEVYERAVNVVTEWDRPASQLLARAGYRIVRHFWSMEVDLTGEIGPPTNVQGVKLRNFDVTEALETHRVLVEAFRDHWGSDFSNFDDWSAETLERKGYDPKLWWVAEAEGKLVGVLVAEEATGTGWVIDLGVLREWRKRGIGRALLLQAFDDFKQRGLTRAALGVDSESLTGATRLYENVGMTKYRQIDFYGKDLVTAGT